MRLNLQVTPVYEENWKTRAKINVNRGGTRSSKTYSIMQILITWLFTGYVGAYTHVPRGFASVVRKTLPALKASAYRDALEILTDNNLYGLLDKHNRSSLTFTYGERHLEFFSVDNPQKVRSRKREILFCAEGNELTYKGEFYQLLVRTRRKVFIDFNPDNPDIWINTELEQRRRAVRRDVKVIVSNYTWNPFLTDEEVKEIEYTKHVDPELWEVFGKGEYGKITGLIFPNYKVIETFPEGLDIDLQGLDFGFNDPLAMTRVGVEDGALYLDELYYQRFKTLPVAIQEWEKSTKIDKRKLTYADSHRPGQIKELKDNGWLVKKAEKGKDSVNSGIMHMKGFQMYVTARSENLLRELRRYKWVESDEGESTDLLPVDNFNHAIDAARYPIYTHLFKPKRSLNITKI